MYLRLLNPETDMSLLIRTMVLSKPPIVLTVHLDKEIISATRVVTSILYADEVFALGVVNICDMTFCQNKSTSLHSLLLNYGAKLKRFTSGNRLESAASLSGS